MDPITTREWQMLLDAINGLRDSIDNLHADISSQKIKVVELSEQYRTVSTKLEEIQESNRFRWQYFLLPVVLVLLGFLLPRLTWVK